MTRRLALLLAALIVASPAAAAVNVMHDWAGVPYPPACQRDLAADAELMARVDVELTDSLPREMGGWTVNQLPRPRILIARRFVSFLRADLLQHELCHALLFLNGDNPAFHGNMTEE